jgi:hypothetical protein
MILTRSANRRGAGGIGCLLLIALVAGAIYAGTQLLLPRFRNTSFDERLTEIYPYFSRQTEETIRKRIIDTGSEFDIALSPEQVKVVIKGDSLSFDIDYVKVAELKVWRTTIPFHIHHSGPY